MSNNDQINKLRVDMNRADRAKRILEDEMVRDALSSMRSSITEKWESSKESDTEGRERAFRMLHALNEFERYFTTIIQTGKYATAELSRIQKLKQKVRDAFN